MVRHNFEYPKEGTNTINRYKHQADYSLQTIHTIINTSPVLHVSFSPSPTDPFPVILPMIGQMGSFSRPSASLGDTLDCYLHGYVSSRIMNLARSSTSPSTTSSTSTPTETKTPGLPVCIAASRVTGLVLTLTPNSHNYNYRSSILFGHASLVESAEEKLYAMELITNSVLASRWENTRVPPNAAEMSSTCILRVNIHSGSAKVREGGPLDEKGDVGNEGTVGRVWTGTLPLWEQLGEPVPGPYNAVKEVPEHITAYREEFNRESKMYAEEAARKDAPVPGKKEGDE
ncbi:putative flavin-nucleotide-binding protein [Leptodontidium sp. 2 PMI_412]|nr:putative flavin-nucleotide-binding protein [Leptodontidium sp. 2 PMI_412]